MDSNLAPVPTSELDSSAQEEASAHLNQLQHNRKLLHGRNRPQKSHRPLVEVLSDALYSKDAEEEVGEDWFGAEHEARKGIVRLNIGRGKDKVEGGIRRLGRIVGRSQDDGKKDVRVTQAVPMLTLDEAFDDDEEPTPVEPIYSGLSLVESPTHSSDSLLYPSDSTTTYDETSSSPTLSALALPTPSPAPASSSASTTSSSKYTPSTIPLGARVSRTLTLSSLQPALPSKHRDHRSDFTPRRKLGTLRPKDFQKVLARRRRKVLRGEVEALDVEGASELKLALVEAGAVLEEEKEQFVVDVLYEHQRGLIVFGLPRFSSAALAQFDPAPWTDASLRDSAFTPHDHPLPTPFWTWENDHWMVDMGHDVDEQGWSYAFRFHSSHWRGEADTWRSFVRRRRWVRARSYRPSLLHSPTSHPSCEINWDALLASALVDCSPEDVVGLRAATAVLPLTGTRKDEVFGWSDEVDARDPFLAWSFVKTEGEGVLVRLKERGTKGSRSEEELWGVWRDAVVEVNLRKVARVMRGCRLDREKLGLWRWWLGAEETAQEESEQRWAEKARQLSPNGRAEQGVDARLWREKGEKRPVLDDVWDLLEGRLDHILQLFEFQLTRLDLLRLVLALHPLKHAHHQYESFDRGHPFQPGVLSPKAVGSRLGRRLDFYRDVSELEKYHEGKIGGEKGGEAEETTKRKGKGKGVAVA